MKTALRSFIFLVIAVTLLFPAGFAASAKSPSGEKLSAHDRELLAEAKANGESQITLLIASVPGKNNAVASAVKGLGGKVNYRDDDISYLRVLVAFDKVEAVAALSGVQAVDVNEVIPLYDPRPEPEGVVGVIPQPAPDASTPNDNPYMPIRDIGASQFMAANPTWDGRGVTIGYLDTGLSLDHRPALRDTGRSL